MKRLLALVVPMVALFGGCDITHYECGEGAVCEAPHDDEVCGALCDRLVACDRIDAGDAPACRDQCRTAMEEDADTTRAGCQCVLDSSCGREEQCDGAPLPAPSDDDDTSGSGSGGSAAGSGGSASAAGGAGTSAGGAGGTACNASCECPEGSSCNNGFCQPASGGGGSACETDCDCTSGDQCVDGACVAGSNR